MRFSPNSLVLALLSLLAAACARAPEPAPEPVPAPAQPESVSSPAPAPAPTAVPPETPTISEAPRDWQLLDRGADGVPGIGVRRAERELLVGKQPRRTVVVAVIDGGVDTAHADLRTNLWTNAKETAGNGKDDDGNGYVDDVHGWNFIGGRDGRDVHHDTYEVTRQYVRCTGKGRDGAANAPPASAPPSADQCARVKQDFDRQRAEAEQQLQQVRPMDAALSRLVPLLKRAAGSDSLTPQRVAAIQASDPDVQRARQIYLQLAASGITPAVVADIKAELESQVEYKLNPSFDPRSIVDDTYADLSQRRYGNTDVMGPDAEHGTHVAGIIGAVRANGVGVDGIAPSVRIMAVRAVPDGDERDKDVANAIRYAVDNGANVINMSFGKAYSPQKGAVDDAVKYADSRGVLMVHAAGNDAEDTGEKPSFPTPTYQAGGRAQNWIEVGASSWKGLDSLVAPFSNYSRKQVDVFAPGVEVLSTVPGGYERNSGTSMASPVVTGLAALLMAYYPNLTAADVKRIILASATRYADQQVVRPGSPAGERVPFGTLSATGGVVNAYGAVKMAEEMSAARP